MYPPLLRTRVMEEFGLIGDDRVWVGQPSELQFERGDGPRVAHEEAQAADRLFDAATRRNPGLFDGPLVLVERCSLEAISSRMVVWWSPSTYRTLAQRPFGHRISTLFGTGLVPTFGGKVLVGRAGPLTAKAGLWQFPGGSVTPPPTGAPLDIDHLATEASRELLEETGLWREPRTLKLWAVCRGDHHNVGMCFRAADMDVRELADVRDFVTNCDEPEFDQLAAVRTGTELAALGRSVDYVEPCLRLYRSESG